MGTAVQHLPCYLVEWYHPELTALPVDDTVAKLDAGAVAMCAEGSAVRLLVALAAHTDQVLYGVFAASSPEHVRQACERAGFPAERVTAGVDARIMPGDAIACAETSSPPNVLRR